MKYGCPYQGSKSKLAEQIIALFPASTHFYDLFSGGGAIAHAALLSGKFQHVHANDISDSVKLFEDALNGNLDKYEPERFRTREEFFAEKDSNPFVRLVYSFGNDQRTYLYGRNIESYKKAVHEMLYATTVNERRLKFKAVMRELERLGIVSTSPPPSLWATSSGGSKTTDWLGQYDRLQTHERLEQIKGIKP